MDDDPHGVDPDDASDDDRYDTDETPVRRRAFPLALIAGLAAWKAYDAVVAETMRAAAAPSLYVLGLAVFAVSVLGPRRLQLVTFFAGATLCLAAMAFDVRP